MKVVIFDTHSFEKKYFEAENQKLKHELTFFEVKLNKETACLAAGFPVVCAFVNDRLDSDVLKTLSESGTKLIALRSAGFNHVDLSTAKKLGMTVVRVPEYSPYAVAEHAVALILSLSRKIHRAYSRVHDGNFTLDGLIGFDLHGKTVGIIGTGKIGTVMTKIMNGFGCKILAHDVIQKPVIKNDYHAEYVELPTLLKEADVISLHVPLNRDTHHMINEAAFHQMKKGVMLINTGRGGLIDTHALIQALKAGHIGYAGLDVYEEEEKIFFQDFSEQILQDDIFARLLTFPNVLITSHQAFLTHEALTQIARTTLKNIRDFENGLSLTNEISVDEVPQGSLK